MLTEWQALSGRIRGLLQAGHFYLQAFAIRSSDSYGGGRQLLDQSSRVFQELEAFISRFSTALPAQAKATLDRFVEKQRPLFMFTDKQMPNERIKAALTMLAALDSEVTFLLSDIQAHIRRRSERAFVHLQRSIAADSAIREKWCTAFDDGETACEKLGAVQLLLHGIWAFKADAAGASTDLVFGEPLDDVAELERAADGLVLTEWKQARSDSEIPRQFQKGREQASRYAGGALAGIELLNYRFVVVVTKRIIKSPPDHVVGDVTFRHVNIAVDPQTPSRR